MFMINSSYFGEVGQTITLAIARSTVEDTIDSNVCYEYEMSRPSTKPST